MAKILVAMSGGVDSSATALLLQQAGHVCLGATMQLLSEKVVDAGLNYHAAQDVHDAQAVCEKLGIPHHTIAAEDAFTEQVIQPFSDAYAEGLTPNPCIRCNKYLKFGLLWDVAQELGCDGLATGHYARLVRNSQMGLTELHTALDSEKDQSYVLHSVPQEILQHLYLPLGELANKDETRRIAEEHGLLTAHKSESQDICFVPDGDYAAFLERYREEAFVPGEIVDGEGQLVGEHQGIERFTIGQRKGVDVAMGHRVYVVDKDPVSHQIRIDVEEALYTSKFFVQDINWVSGSVPSEPVQGEVVVCYHGRRYPVEARPIGATELKITSELPIRAIAPGQSAVLYSGTQVLAGGIIKRTCSPGE